MVKQKYALDTDMGLNEKTPYLNLFVTWRQAANEMHISD